MRTSELTGAALDWAVAKCERADSDVHGGVVWLGTKRPFSPSVDWSQGGPIIEREKINLIYHPDIDCSRGEVHQRWLASVVTNSVSGPTPLIAAMRCYVASRLGDEVEVPPELV
jgi:hypothetical protein